MPRMIPYDDSVSYCLYTGAQCSPSSDWFSEEDSAESDLWREGVLQTTGTRQGPTWEAMLGREKNAEVDGPGPVGFTHRICQGLQVKTFFTLLTNTLIDELPPT